MNIRYALRRLLQRPGFTLTAVLSLAIGIGANTAIFSVVNAVLLREVPLRDPERLVNVYLQLPHFPYLGLSYPDYDDVVRGSGEVFEGVLGSRLVSVPAEHDGEVETILGEVVTGNYFRLLGVGAQVGRTLLPEDDLAPGAHPVVVLGHSYWKSRFGADTDVAGKTLRLGDRPYEIVGVAPEGYPGDRRGLAAAFFAPRMMVDVLAGVGGSELQHRGKHSNSVKARLRPGVSLVEARTVVEGIAGRLRERGLEDWDPQGTFELVPTSEVVLSPSVDPWLRATGWLLTVVVGLLLLLACTNLAGFLLAQAVDRRREMSLRLALGASRRALFAQLLTESVLLAALGGVAGLLAAAALLQLRVDLPLPLPIELGAELDLAVLGYTAGITLLAGIGLGLAPALQGTKPELVSTLKPGTAGGGVPGPLMLRSALIGVQVAISTVLLVGAGLFLRSFQERMMVDPGFGEDPAAVLSFMVPSTRFDEERGRRYVEGLLERLEQVPGVLDIGLVDLLHLGLNTSWEEFHVDGVEPPPGSEEGHRADKAVVGPGFFAAAGVRITRGRNFDDHDRPDTQRVAIVSQALADRFFAGTDPIGRFLRKEGEQDLIIVGVASDAKVRSVAEEPRPFIYRAYSQTYSNYLTVVAHTSRDPEALALELLATAKEYDPGFWTREVTTMVRHIGVQALPAQVTALLLSVFALVAMTLAAIGLYGIVSYSVSKRSREIAIRVALGAERGAVVRMLMATGLRPVVVGAVSGILVIAVLAGRLLAGLLFAVSPLDPWAFLSTVAVLSVTAVAAAWFPARRVSRLRPVRALRFE